MMSFGPELAGISLSVLGWVLSVISCALPMWMVYSFTDEYNEDRDPRVEWWGLWMSCVSWSTGKMQCSLYELIDPELEAIRALCVVTIIVGMLGVFTYMVEAKCINFIQNERGTARVMASPGGVFIIAALVQLVLLFWLVYPIPWYNSDSKWKPGVALYLGLAASFLMFIGGSILYCICHPEEEKPRKYNLHGQSYVKYSATLGSTAQSSDNERDEV